MAENRYKYTFTLSINGGKPQSVESGGIVETWNELANVINSEMTSLVNINAAMGLKDWRDG